MRSAVWFLVASLLTASPAVGTAGGGRKKAGEQGAGQVLALRGGKVITVSGRTLRRGTVLIKDGKIEAVGDEVRIPEDAEVVDCRGKVITPGFIPAVAWGVGLSTGGFPFARAGEAEAPGAFFHAHDPGCLCGQLDWLAKLRDPRRPELEKLSLFLPGRRRLLAATMTRLATQCCPYLEPLSEPAVLGLAPAADAIKDTLNPESRDVVLANAAGITATWLPSKSGFSLVAVLYGAATPPTAGTAGAVLKMARDRLDEMFVSRGRFLVMDFRHLAGRKRYELLAELADTRRYRQAREAYEEAKEDHKKARVRYRAAKKAGQKVGAEPRAPRKPKKPRAARRWMPLFEGKRVLRVWAETVPQIRLALDVASRYGLRLVIDDATEGWVIPGEIARAGAGVVVNPRRRVDETTAATSSDRLVYRHGWSIENAAILSRSGVKVAIVPPAPALVMMGIPGRDLLTLALDAAFAVRGGMSRGEALRALTLNPAAMLGIDDRVGSLEPGKDADLLVLDGDPFDHKTFVERTYVNGRLVYEKATEPLFDHVKRGRVVKPVWEWPAAGK